MVDENKNLDPNRPPEEFQEGGGPAVTASDKSNKRSGAGFKGDITSAALKGGASGGVEGAKEAVKDKTAKAAGEAVGDTAAAALASTGVGTLVAGAGRWISKKATELAVKWGLKDGNWLKVALAPIISLILIFTVSAIAIAGIVRANRGVYGNEAPSPISITNPEDRSDLNELMRLSGDYSAEDAAKILELLDKIADKVALGELTFADKDKAIQTMDKIGALAELFVTNSATSSSRSELTAAIEEFIDLYTGDNPAPLSGNYLSPVGNQEISGFNGSTHGRSVVHPSSRYDNEGKRIHHDVFKGFDSPGTGDAVDISFGGLGKPVYAMFAGTTTPSMKNKETGEYQCLTLVSSDSRIEALYCHIKDFKTGEVKAGDQLGVTTATKTGHLHLEIWINGKSIHTTEDDINSNKYSEVGNYMWDHIKTIFGF